MATKIRYLPIVLQRLCEQRKKEYTKRVGIKPAYPDEVMGSFSWIGTPEGDPFWRAVNNMDWKRGHYYQLQQLQAMFPHIKLGYEFGTPDSPKDKVYLLHRTKYVTISQHS